MSLPFIMFGKIWRDKKDIFFNFTHLSPFTYFLRPQSPWSVMCASFVAVHGWEKCKGEKCHHCCCRRYRHLYMWTWTCSSSMHLRFLKEFIIRNQKPTSNREILMSILTPYHPEHWLSEAYRRFLVYRWINCRGGMIFSCADRSFFLN